MSNLSAMLMKTINASSALIPTDDTKTFSVLSTLDEGRYYLTSVLVYNPISKVLTQYFTDGVNHITDATKKIVRRASTDKGSTYGSKTTVYDPTDGTMQVQDPGIGCDNNGRTHFMVDCHSTISTTGGTHELRYFYSDDDGVTISTPVVIPFPATLLATMRPYGRITQRGNVLIAPCYFQTEESTGGDAESERWVLRSTDGGANWTWVLVHATATSTFYINESECVWVTDDIVFMVSRYEFTKGFWMYKSIDKGLTWESLGVYSPGITLTIAGPPRIHKFKADDGTDIVVLYFADRGNDRLYAIYGRLDIGVIGGRAMFNTTTRSTIRQDTEWLHYGDMFHYNNNMNARGAWPREASAVFLEDNEMIYFESSATIYGGIFSILSPVTIYDHLTEPMGIYTRRGLVVNTANDVGEVNGSGQVTLLKSLLPGPTGQNFSATAGGIILGDGIEFDGTKALSHGTSSYWQSLQYSSAGESDVNYTIYFNGKFGIVADPNALYGLFGNSQASSGSRGAAMGFDDRVSQPRSNAFQFTIAKGSAGNYIIQIATNDTLPVNTKFNGRIEVDLSQVSNNDKVKLYVNNVFVPTTVTVYNTGVVTTPSFNMQIGALGNNANILVGNVYDFVVQNAIDIESVRNDMTNTLMDLEGL
jgi:hypothetical protein